MYYYYVAVSWQKISEPQADHKRKHLRAFGTDNYQCESNEWMANSSECINRLKQNKEHKRLQLDNETTEATSKYQQFAEKPEKPGPLSY